jgi:hypothetical protein
VEHLVDGWEPLGGDDCRGELTALHVALIGTLGVVGDDHELRVTWASSDGMVGPVERDHR